MIDFGVIGADGRGLIIVFMVVPLMIVPFIVALFMIPARCAVAL